MLKKNMESLIEFIEFLGDVCRAVVAFFKRTN